MTLRSLLIMVALLAQRDALAYRPFDSTDADVAHAGEVEIELGPVQWLRQGGKRFLQAPALIVRGEHDGIATEEDVVAFFSRLPNADRQLVILAGASHATALGFNRRQLWHAMRAFLEMPERLDRRS